MFGNFKTQSLLSKILQRVFFARIHVLRYKSIEEVRRAREEAAWDKQLKDARRKEERLQQLEEQRLIDLEKRKNRVVERSVIGCFFCLKFQGVCY
jgi:hypothetical protein